MKNCHTKAAAPDMLDVLNMCEGYLIADVRAEEKKGDKSDHLNGAREMLSRITQVIQQAEGK